MKGKKIAINGLGRIGRHVFKQSLEKGLNIVAVNDMADPETLAYLLNHDSFYGGYKNKISKEEIISFCKKRIAAYKYPRAVEIIEEVPKTKTGKFLRKELRNREIRHGA